MIAIVRVVLKVNSVYLSSKLWNMKIIVGTLKFIYSLSEVRVTLGIPEFGAGI